MSHAVLDFETYSEAGYYQDATGKWRGITKTAPGLPAVGAPAYAEHPSCRVLSLAWDLHDGSGPRLWIPGMPAPTDLFAYLQAGGLVEAHNAGFEYWIWHFVCHGRMGWPALLLSQLTCSMAKCRAHSLPGKLGKAAEVLGAAEQKDKAGDALIRKLCVPTNTAKRPTLGDYNALYQYNIQDIRAEAAVSSLCPDLSVSEQALWRLDQAINIRGVAIDVPALGECIRAVQRTTERYTEELRDVTGGSVQSVGELAKITAWLATQGVRASSLESDAVDELLKDTLMPAAAHRVLTIRSALGSASVKKLFAIERRLTSDGRLHDLFAFCGADRTGRWAGRGPQPQNLPGGSTPERVDEILAGLPGREPSLDVIADVSGCLRGLFVGEDLICSDFSAIEAVVIAEIAGEEWRQEVFRTHGKIYEMSASRISGIPFDDFMCHYGYTVEDLKKPRWWEYDPKGDHHKLRKAIGKPAELGSGFGGSSGAWKNFGADKFLSDEEIATGVSAWRAASPAIAGRREGYLNGVYQAPLKGLWYGLQDAAFMAVTNHGHCYSYQAPPTAYGQPPAITYGVQNDILYCLLPSGRQLTYHTPRFGTNRWGSMELTYMGWNSNYLNGPVGWMRLNTWGGKLVENVVQAVARDILAHAMTGLDAAGYPIVLHVHDEIVAEMPPGQGSVEEFEQIMGRMPQWAADWPVRAAGGWRGRRYRK